ncbi:hypothetical protein NDU88_001686 [Pleurodeles waltl]|uniref:Uncharacterized protein n=1 Tax=Pleurodeles waltl TaxID=8319 RepID=A0AAV7S9M2_PLEWA|nr:hypothetical protein NDU88_001686 [Pleurodeles waltl]
MFRDARKPEDAFTSMSRCVLSGLRQRPFDNIRERCLEVSMFRDAREPEDDFTSESRGGLSGHQQCPFDNIRERCLEGMSIVQDR